uniref:Uncharacterized protein n=1 Tax=Lotharella oceanica TaxID=641309 RepID=A0A7S2XB65_9EUKA
MHRILARQKLCSEASRDQPRKPKFSTVAKNFGSGSHKKRNNVDSRRAHETGVTVPEREAVVDAKHLVITVGVVEEGKAGGARVSADVARLATRRTVCVHCNVGHSTVVVDAAMPRRYGTGI